MKCAMWYAPVVNRAWKGWLAREPVMPVKTRDPDPSMASFPLPYPVAASNSNLKEDS